MSPETITAHVRNGLGTRWIICPCGAWFSAEALGNRTAKCLWCGERIWDGEG